MINFLSKLSIKVGETKKNDKKYLCLLQYIMNL